MLTQFAHVDLRWVDFSSQREMLDLLLSELEFITDLIWTYPGHEVVWHHR